MQTKSLLGPGGSPSFANVTIAAGGTFDLYNTADQTTNYERLRASFISNRAEIGTFFAGTGTPRQMRVGAGTASTLSSFLGFYSQQFPFIEAVMPNTASSGVLAELFKGTFTGSSGTQTIASIQPTFNQSGTAGYTALDINPTETATGSGTKLFQRWAVGGSAVAQMHTTGLLYTNNIYAYNTLGFSSALGSTGDVLLNRDAADTLALRRAANAQTFRIAQTYTDASNRRYLQMYFSGSQAIVYNTGNGTAAGAGGLFLSSDSGGNLDFGVGGAAYWRVSGSGAHLLAVTDNTTDIGASGANRPRNLYIGGSASFGQYYGSAIAFTVATLSAAGLVSRARAFVSDSTVAAAGNYGAIVAGGGANIVPVWSDGTNWRIG